ncbi:PDDEXK nuclease domain-containing protein [Clavibacter tessellarius]|uniref:PDDEXK nuclease domain-containing protein n=1 Tax=Clavibacter tessellarius TaxID=31965 RepID=UPI003248937A
MDRIVDTLRELGAGFAFVGRQVHFDVDGDDFYVDLLFFHTEQLRYVVIEPQDREVRTGLRRAARLLRRRGRRRDAP